MLHGVRQVKQSEQIFKKTHMEQMDLIWEIDRTKDNLSIVLLVFHQTAKPESETPLLYLSELGCL